MIPHSKQSPRRLLAAWPVVWSAVMAAVSTVVFSAVLSASPIARTEDSAKPPPSPAQEALDEARTDLLAGRLTECREALGFARKADPELPPVDLLVARIWLDARRTGEALRFLEQAALTVPDHPELFATFGDLAGLTGRPTDARVQYERALATPAPESWSATRQTAFRRELYARLGLLAEDRGQWSQGLQTYQNWLKNQPEELEAVAGVARCQAALGQVDAAREGFSRVHAKQLTSPRPEHALALALHRSGNVAEAEKCFRKVFAESPDVALARADYVSLLLMEDRPEDALQQWNLLPEGTRGDRRARFLRGLIARYLGDGSTAEFEFGSLHRNNPLDWQAADQLALVLIELPDEGKRARAAQLADANLRSAPDRATALATAGWVRLRLGDLVLASRLLDESAVDGGMTPQLAYYLAEHRVASGRKEEAAGFREQALKLTGLCVQRTKIATALTSQ